MTGASNIQPEQRLLLSAAGWIVLPVVVIGAGYLGFRYFAGTAMPQMDAYGLPFLALIAGIAAFFSPCAFPLLPGYLAFFAEAGNGSNRNRRALDTLKLGLAGAMGVITFTLGLGIVIGLLGAGAGKALSISSPQPGHLTLWVRGGVGVILVVLGIGQGVGVNLKLAIADRVAWLTRPAHQREHGPALFYLYGLGYTSAGMGCTGPILAGLTVFALAGGGFNAALAAFLIFSATMAGLMVLVSGLVAASQNSLIRQLKAGTRRIKQAGSVLLVLVGLFNIFTVLNTTLFVQLLFP